MSEELHFPVVQPVPDSPADRACRKARMSSCSAREYIGVLDGVVVALESDDDNFWSR